MPVPIIKPRKTRRHAFCPHVVDGALDAWCAAFRSCVISGAKRGMMNTMRDKFPVNMLHVTKVGLKIMNDKGWSAIPTDKDGGFAIHQAADIPIIHQRLLNSSFYEQVHSRALDCQGAASMYCKLSKRIENIERSRGLAATLNASLMSKRGWKAKLRLTTKTHKPQGQVKHRNIHAQPGYAFGGVSAWVSKQLRLQLSSLPHLLVDSRDLCKKLKSISVNDQCYFMKFDLKDYFLSGSAGELFHDSMRGFERSDRSILLADCLWFLLDQQFCGE